MTTQSPAYHATETRAAGSWPLYAALGAGVSVVLTAVGTFWNITGNESPDYDFVSEYLPVAGIIVVATALVFGLVVRGAEGRGAGIRALVLAILSFLSLAVFWAGLPAVLAFGAVACALAARGGSGGLAVPAKVGLAISAVTLALAVTLAIVG